MQVYTFDVAAINLDQSDDLIESLRHLCLLWQIMYVRFQKEAVLCHCVIIGNDPKRQDNLN